MLKTIKNHYLNYVHYVHIFIFVFSKLFCVWNCMKQGTTHSPISHPLHMYHLSFLFLGFMAEDVHTTFPHCILLCKVMVCHILRNFPTWTLSIPESDSSFFMVFKKHDDAHLTIWKQHTFLTLQELQCVCALSSSVPKTWSANFFVTFHRFCTEHSSAAYQSNLLQPFYWYNPREILAS
jgi:hypothetical protein